MSRFPGEIKFTTAEPSGAVGAVPVQLDVRTGEGQVFGALADLGSQLTDIGRKYKVLEREIELSEKSAELQIILSTALQGMENAPDKDAVNAIYEEARKKTGTIKSEDPTVTHELGIRMNVALAGFKIKGQGISNKIQIKNLEIREEVLRQKALDEGDTLAFEASIARSVVSGMPREAGKQLVREFAVNSALSQIRITADTDPQKALDMIGELKNLSRPQLDMKDKLERLAKRKLKDNFDKAERDLTKLLIAGDLTPELNEDMFKAGITNPQLFFAFDKILEQEAISNSSKILDEKRLNNDLTRFDVVEAQKSGFLTSNQTDAWLRRLEPENKFNVGLFDEALTKIQEVRNNKGKQPEVRQWLLRPEIVEALGSQWKELRNGLDEAFEYRAPKGSEPYRSNATKAINEFSTLLDKSKMDVVREVQRMRNAIDSAPEKTTPEGYLDLTEKLLLPHQKKQSRGWFSRLMFGGPIHMLSSEFLTPAQHIRRIFGNEPATITEYETQLEQFALNGEDKEGLEYERRWGTKF